MPRAPHRLPLAFESLDDVVAAIRKRGGRLSAPRRRVLEALFTADGPVSAEFLADELNAQAKSLDRTSVYRNLQQLEELGVVHHVHVGHGPGLYVLEGAVPRAYLVCERCDRVDAVDAAQLERTREAIRADAGYEVRFSHFPLVGLCSACAAAEPHAHGPLTHDHPHTADDHEHQHTHGDYAHSHSHTHQHGLEHRHQHTH